MWQKLQKINEDINVRFPEGNNPFMIITRLQEECGELAAEVNHFEKIEIKQLKKGEPDRKHLATEMMDVIGKVIQLSMYYHLDKELNEIVDEYYQRVVDEKLVTLIQESY